MLAPGRWRRRPGGERRSASALAAGSVGRVQRRDLRTILDVAWVRAVHHRTLRDSMDDGFVNKRALQRQGCIEGEIPAVAFTEALPSVAAFAFEVASDATGVGCVWMLEGVVDGAVG